MSAESVESKFKELFVQLPSPKDKFLFEDIAVKIWKIIDLKKPDSPEEVSDLMLFEAFLISLLCYLTPMDEGNIVKKDDAKKRDYYLLTYGLLDGYYHTIEIDGVKYNNKKRFDMHFNSDDYKAIGNTKSAHKRAIDRCKEDVCDVIADIRQDKERCKEFLKSGCNTYIIYGEDNRPKINLPKPCFTLENFPSNKKSGAASELSNKTDVPQPDGKETESSQNLKRLPKWELKESNTIFKNPLTYMVFVSGLVCFSILGALYVWNNREKLFWPKDTPSVEEIYVFNSEITLSGKRDRETLDIRVSPKKASMKNLKHTDYDTDIIAVEEIDTETWDVIALRDWQSNKQNDTTINIWADEENEKEEVAKSDVHVALQNSYANGSDSPQDSEKVNSATVPIEPYQGDKYEEK